jgi:hypothetical protein
MVDQETLDRANGHASSVTRNVADLTHDLVALAELQGQLLSADVREGTAKSRGAAALLAGAPVLALSATPVLLLGLARLLETRAGWSETASLLTVGGTAVLLAALLGWFGWKQLRKAVSVMTRSKEEFAENVRWLKAALSRGPKV